MPNDNIPNRYNWFDKFSIDPMSKDEIAQLYISKILNRTQKMFKYKNLPETIPQKDLELLLQCNGYAIITKVNGKLYALRGGLGGTPNVYYLPTIATVANPALNYSGMLEIDKECVVMQNDSLYQGLMPLIKHNAYLLAECDISFKFATINTRIPSLVSAPDDVTKKEAEKFFEQITEGNKIGVIADEGFFDKLKVYNYANSATLVQHLIELKQYISGTFYQELGIQSSFNMKREAINEAEAALNTDILFPLIDDMLEKRQIAIDKINAMYGTNIEIEFDCVWASLRQKQDLGMQILEEEANPNGEEAPKNLDTESDEVEDEQSE